MERNERACLTCQTVFKPWRVDQAACSSSCRIKMSNEARRTRLEEKRWRECFICNERFRSIRGAVTCSTSCYLRLPEVRERRNRQLRAWHARPEALEWRRNKDMRIKYGIDSEQYAAMLLSQRGRCAICGEAPSRSRGPSGRLHVDHDHDSGRVRGLLCGRCNPGLGYFKDDPARLRAAVRYLQGQGAA